MVKFGAVLLLSLGITGVANAGSYQLKPGDWQFYEGLNVGKQYETTASNSRTICVAPSKTTASANWLMDLAKPRPDCTTSIISQNDHEIKANMTCPMGSGAMKGPSIIKVYPDHITIDNQLEYDLPYAPLYMGQQKTVRHISNQCSVPQQ